LKPRLVTVAHGTRHPDGPSVISSLVSRVRRRLPDVDVAESYVELVEPAFESVMAAAEGPSIVVPLLLSTGHHVTHDLPGSAALSPFPVTLTRPLGPDPLLAAAGARQLRAAGATRGDAVVLAVAGSKDPDAEVDALAAGRMLRARWGAPVKVAFLSGAGPGVAEVVALLRAEGHRRVAASPYLLAPGHFTTKAATLAKVSGATTVADVLGRHPLVAELVVRRYCAARRAALGSMAGSTRGSAMSVRRTRVA
jgi:sirohydrochlorin ferrochelatase